MSGCSVLVSITCLPGPDLKLSPLNCRNSDFHRAKTFSTDQGMDLAIAGARELVAVKSNVIVAVGPEISLRAALAPNSGLPIVILAFNYDPIARGYVESLAHPGGILLECLPVNRNSQ
jgi:hypothetical protein